MEEEYSMDPAQLLVGASDFAYNPGSHSDASAKEFLDRFPLPAIITALQTKSDVPGLENALVACLERVFRTKFGASLIPLYMSALLMSDYAHISQSFHGLRPHNDVIHVLIEPSFCFQPFVVVGLGAESEGVRCLSCKTVFCLLENLDEATIRQLFHGYDVYPLLLNCLVDGDEQVATASMGAIKKLADSPKGMDIVFPANTSEPTHLRNLAARCSSLGRVRVLALIVKLFAISGSVASVIYHSNLLSLLEAEVSNTNDTLMILSVLELLYELAEIQHSAEFLSKTTLLQLLSSIISNPSADSILRSRSMMISGRLMSKENAYMYIDESCVNTVVSAIDQRFGLLESQDADECECALDALGQIGSSNRGAALLLSSSPPVARHVVNAAFDQQGHGKQLAALHALGNIAGETRSENNVILNGDLEESLRHLLYEAASKTPKLTPSGCFLSVLQQEPEMRLAGYRVLMGLVARPWCLMEICSRQEIIHIVTDTYTETTKIGMEARHHCCQAIHKAFMSSSNLFSDPAFAGIAAKLQEAISKGPYLTKKHPEAQPSVMTAERF
ncbi:unnamed protein product [Ilex paraguariensis]|uniref:ARM repeat superfamily protein n=1 Tax=Ilex paraguariensis TaxID=185542 RepID=A0ABC8U2A2_9AQUA